MSKNAPKTDDSLLKYTSDLTALTAALELLGQKASNRLTMPQASFFLIAAQSDLRGSPETFTEIRDRLGPKIHKSLHSTYKVLTDENRMRDGKREQGLGWLLRETDPRDNRRKYLRLTAKGRALLRDLGGVLQREFET